MKSILIISSSTRPGRKGPVVARWVEGQIKKHGQFIPELVDLGELKLPLMDEEKHPFTQEYKHDHTWHWSRLVDKAEAFVFVTAEYNFSYPAPLKNALDYLYKEWNYKPAGIVSYGGISGGLRAFGRLKGDLPSYCIMPLASSVAFPSFGKFISEGGEFLPPEQSTASMQAMLDELLALSKSLETMRNKRD